MDADLISLAQAQAPMALLLAPLAGAALIIAAPSGRLAWFIACCASLIAAAAAIDVTVGVELRGANLYEVGGWGAPLGVTLRIDGLGAFGLSLVSVAAALAIISALGPMRREVERARQPVAMALSLLATAGALGMIAAGDLFTMFAFMQMASISASALVGLGADADRRAAPAALRLLLWSAAGGALYAFGAGLLYLSTGSFDVARAAGVLNAGEHLRSVVAGVAFIITGLSVAAALAPLHAGLVGALGRGPSFCALLLGGALAPAGLMALARLMALLGAASAPGVLSGASIALLALGVTSVLIGSVQACVATDLRRLAAYVITAQAGCVAIGLSTGSQTGMIGALFHALNQVGVAFVLLGAGAQFGAGAAPLSHLDGLARRDPLLAGAITVAALSLVGAPLTAGFLSKWLLLQATLEVHFWGGAIAVVGSSLMAMIYVGRLCERLYLRAPALARPPARGGWTAGPAMAAAVVAALAFGIESAPPLNAARAAADAMAWGPSSAP